MTPISEWPFADRVYHHLTGNGALTPARAIARYRFLAENLEPAIPLEAARWGDANAEDAYSLRDWQAERDRLVLYYFPRRTAIVFQQFIRHELYPRFPPPSMLALEEPGHLWLEVEEGEVWFTTDGSDPRKPGGAINPQAESGNEALIRPGQELKARCFLNGAWSALASISL